MIFYKVKPAFDNWRYSKNFDILIGNELYTEKELEKLKQKYFHCYSTVYNFDKIFDKVEIKKNKTHWFFGARFENK